MIDSVSVERVLPRTLKIRVTEREPVAQVNVPRADGGERHRRFRFSTGRRRRGHAAARPAPVRRAAVADERRGLPVITGLNLYQLQPGHRVEMPQAQAALQLITAFDHSPMAGLGGFAAHGCFRRRAWSW